MLVDVVKGAFVHVDSISPSLNSIEYSAIHNFSCHGTDFELIVGRPCNFTMVYGARTKKEIVNIEGDPEVERRTFNQRPRPLVGQVIHLQSTMPRCASMKADYIYYEILLHRKCTIISPYGRTKFRSWNY